MKKLLSNLTLGLLIMGFSTLSANANFTKTNSISQESETIITINERRCGQKKQVCTQDN